MEDTICTTAPRPELRELQRMNIMQSEGSYQTYMRKYLYLNLFDIVEPDAIDALPQENNQQVNRNNTKHYKKPNPKNKPACFESVVAKCHELFPDRECDEKLLNSVSLKMMKSNELTKKEREEFYRYLHGG